MKRSINRVDTHFNSRRVYFQTVFIVYGAKTVIQRAIYGFRQTEKNSDKPGETEAIF